MKDSDFCGNTRSASRKFGDVLARIEQEIATIEKELKDVSESVKDDLESLYESKKTMDPANQMRETLPEFQKRHHKRLVDIKTSALNKAKNDLCELRAEIQRS